jgi:hypothetical protein
MSDIHQGLSHDDIHQERANRSGHPPSFARHDGHERSPSQGTIKTKSRPPPIFVPRVIGAPVVNGKSSENCTRFKAYFTDVFPTVWNIA